MRTISDELNSLLTNKNISGLTQKVLLYRRYWDSDTSSFLLEETGTDITSQLSNDSSNGKIKYALDTDEVNVWKISNLTLIFENSRNQFYEGKSDGYFPSPYIIYGSRIEYYIGSPVLNDYVRCFTGYLTDSPNYRFDDNLVEFQALSRLDWLDNISAESVSTTITDEQTTETDTSNCITINSAVGRITKVLKGMSLAVAVELVEGTDYTISQLNDYDNGAIIALESELLTGEHIYASYIYWRKGLMIDELVVELLDAADIDESHRTVEPVIFQNATRVADETSLSTSWAWLYAITADSATTSISGGGVGSDNNTYYSYNPSKDTFPAVKTMGCRCEYGQFKIKIDTLTDVGGSLTAEGYFILLSASLNIGLRFGGAGSSANRDDVHFFVGSTETKIADGNVGYTFELDYQSDGTVTVYRNGTSIYMTTITTNLVFTETKIFASYDACIFQSSEISAKENSYDDYKTYPYIHLQNTKSDVSFAGFDRLNATISTASTPTPSILVRYSDDGGTTWTDYIDYILGTSLNLNYATIDFAILNSASFGNNYNLSDVKLWTFVTQNIPLGVCDLTDMSVMSALKELAKMAMYEIGFDADDKFFFRKRVKTSALKELDDSKIIEISNFEKDFDRLKTKITVGYGNYNKVVDSNTLGEEHPHNIDKYGTRIEEISAGQLLPADNVDLAYAIAPTMYAELSVLRTVLTMTTIIDLELELGDYVRIKHNNNLLTDKNFTDYTKWQELGIYYMKCKVAGISTDFNNKKTVLNLIDYTTEDEAPSPEGETFMYELPMKFQPKK